METQNPLITKMPTVSESNTNAKWNAHKELPSVVEIQAWIVSYLAELLEIDPDEVNTTISFDQYGLDSSAAVGMTGDLEDWLGRKLDPTLLYDYPTVEGLAWHLGSDLKA